MAARTRILTIPMRSSLTDEQQEAAIEAALKAAGLNPIILDDTSSNLTRHIDMGMLIVTLTYLKF